MDRPLRHHRWLLAGIVLIALAARLAAGLAQHSVVPEYPSYYATVAEELAHGHGLTVPYAWSYMTPAVDSGLGLPRPAFEVWLPAASLVSVPFVPLLGGTLASKLAGALTGAILVLLVAILGRRTALATGRPRRAADVFSLAAAGLVAITLPLVTGSISSDSQALFGVTTLAGVLAVERAVESGRRRDLVVAGLILGAGLLTRNETVFLVAGALAAVVWSGRAGLRDARARLADALTLGITAAACYLPWAVRQWVVFGTPVPSQTAANAFSVSPQDI
ncbi:MAG: glycosyltransferase family 39 protein, partial [Chloroflexota bacterium]